MTKIYGIKNCSTVKKALNFLDEHEIEYEFHDYKKVGANRADLKKFVKKFGWEKVLNRKGMTWRNLSADEQRKITDQDSAIELMIEKTSIIKRPILDLGSNQLLGFNESEYLEVMKGCKK
jgi:arsenate reductase